MVVGGSQRLLSLNSTTVMVVLLLGLWLLLGCDKNLDKHRLQWPCVGTAKKKSIIYGANKVERLLIVTAQQQPQPQQQNNHNRS